MEKTEIKQSVEKSLERIGLKGLVFAGGNYVNIYVLDIDWESWRSEKGYDVPEFTDLSEKYKLNIDLIPTPRNISIEIKAETGNDQNSDI